MKCGKCGGRGVFNKKTCDACQGTGYENVSENGEPRDDKPPAPPSKVFRLYVGPSTLTQAQANQEFILWTPRAAFPDLNKAIETAWQIDQAGAEVPWIIESDDGQRLERNHIRQQYQQP
jgi:hypothetical protein